MPNRVPLQSIVVQRDGASMCPPIGHPFDFTAEEVASIEKMNPGALTAEATVDLSKSDSKATGKKAGGEGGDL